MATLHELIAEVSPEELLGAIGELYHHVLGYVRSMALKCAVDLGIPDAVNRRGGAATLADIATDTGVHPSKLADLRRMMELLSTTGMIFDSSTAGDGGDVVYRLTTVGRFIAGPSNFSPVVQFAVIVLLQLAGLVQERGRGVQVAVRHGAWLLHVGDGEQEPGTEQRHQQRHGCQLPDLP